MTIHELINKLIEGTKADAIEWESPSQGAFRHITVNGAISIVKVAGGYYSIRLYEYDTCFASYQTLDDGILDRSADELYSAIIDSINRAIERKIGDVFGSIF